MTSIARSSQPCSSGEWTSAIDAAFSRSLAECAPTHSPEKTAPNRIENSARSQGITASSPFCQGTLQGADAGGEIPIPLRMPLDISNAPSLALPDDWVPVESAQDKQFQQDEFPSSMLGDQQGPINRSGNTNGTLDASPPLSPHQASWQSQDTLILHQRQQLEQQQLLRKQEEQRLQHQQQQHILQPHNGPQLDYWQPQVATSQLLAGDPAQQVAQWQEQQQWQQQQQQQQQLVGHAGSRSRTGSPLSHDASQRALLAGGFARLSIDQSRPELLQGVYGRADPALAGYDLRQSVVSRRQPDPPLGDAANSPPLGVAGSNFLSGPIRRNQSWMEQLAPAQMPWNSDGGPGIYGTTEQAAGPSPVGSPSMVSNLGGAAISPRSSDVSPSRFHGPPIAAGGHYGEGARIYVGGVPDLVSVNMVRSHFNRWGQVEDVYFPKERATRRRRPFCFVTFDSLQAAERAVAESNRMIEGYPVASITVPTERSTHYGLRPPPIGSVSVSPTATAAAMPRSADSAFVQAQNVQMAQQAAMMSHQSINAHQQQQQVVVAQLAAAGVDASMLSGMQGDSPYGTCVPHLGQNYFTSNGSFESRENLLRGYPNSTTSNQSTRGGDVNAVSGYSSTTDLMNFMPLDAHGMPINVVALTARHRMDAQLDHSLRATSLGVDEAARLAASPSVHGDANGFIGGLRSTSQVGSGVPFVPEHKHIRSISTGNSDVVRLSHAYGSSHDASAALRKLSSGSGAGGGLHLHDVLGAEGGLGQYPDASYGGSPHTYYDQNVSTQELISQMRAERSTQIRQNGAAQEFGGFTGGGLGASPVNADQWERLNTVSGGGSGGQGSIFTRGVDHRSVQPTAQETWVAGMESQHPGNVPGTFVPDGIGAREQLQSSCHDVTAEGRPLSDPSPVVALRSELQQADLLHPVGNRIGIQGSIHSSSNLQRAENASTTNFPISNNA